PSCQLRRIGEELDANLEVLCRDCHTKLHAEERAKYHLAKYVMLAYETVRLDDPRTYPDMRDALEARCRQLHLVVDKRIDRAIRIVFQPKPSIPRVEFRQTRDSPPIGRAEAIELLRVAFKGFPPEVGMPIAPVPNRSTDPFSIECPRCGPSRGRQSWVVAKWVLCLTCRQWITPSPRALRLANEAE